MTAKNYLLTIISATLVFTSCNKWLDVKPKTQVDAELLYNREAGYKDVLTGAYVNMASTMMYGREMTFGLVDALGNAFAQMGNYYTQARIGNYTGTQMDPLITSIWSKNYNTLANLNNLLSHLNEADTKMFSPDNYNVIKGEAIGLRGYLHFDLLRLFAPSYKSNPAATAIPYVKNYSYEATPFGTVASVLDSVLADLKTAAELLKVSDPIITGRTISASDDDGYLQNRTYHLNYYAVKAALARVYLYKGDLENAALCADEVINSNKFKWITFDEISALDDSKKDRSFKNEQVFVLDVARLSEFIIDRVTPSQFNTASGFGKWFVTSEINTLYSYGNDWRRLFLWTPERNSANPDRYPTKLYQPQGLADSLARRMPMIRIPELYLISAEAALDTDPEKSRDRINTLRKNRGFELDIPVGTPAATLRDEILLEYRREFICEGVLFYYYKRLDANSMVYGPSNFDKANYVLPIPVDETQFR